MAAPTIPGVFPWDGGDGRTPEFPPDIEGALRSLGVAFDHAERFPETLPFSVGDTTAGVENELQAAVIGTRRDVDLPLALEGSGYYHNLLRRTRSGDAPKGVLSDLREYLEDNRENVWENSFVTFPRRMLNPLARRVLDRDLLADKGDPAGGRRTDADRYLCSREGEPHLRIPVSYLLKLSLADAVSPGPDVPDLVRETGVRFMAHFLNDNTSPETFSFHPVPMARATGLGRAVARETAKRYLLTQLLVFYANEKLLAGSGQRARLYFSPLPPVRQARLNDCIPDSFYRELFMNPCLSGWDRGEEKLRYMALCHQVLSRSQMNALGKMRDAGIIRRNLVVLPNPSNISLSNNGTHLSLGSARLAAALGDPSSGFLPSHEKHFGDLVIKIVEHFLPLFVGTYTAAPFRLDFHDFHPERVLGFLPHELDYTHLRMIWRRWRGKARLKILGRPVTPFGPAWLDHALAAAFRLKGDWVPDFRLVGYFVSLRSTDRCAGLDGRPGNDERLKRDLMELGVFDPCMATYLLYRLRECDRMGYSGFEGRHYSLFERMEGDLARAAELQMLVTALAWKWIARGDCRHETVPDDPTVESERRQILFGAAVGLPTFYVRSNTGNALLGRIVKRAERVRPSRRYPGYLRVYQAEYRRALIRALREEAADLIEAFAMQETIRDLEVRLADPDGESAAGRITRMIVDELGVSSPLRAEGESFNVAAERVYRNRLRRTHLEEAFRFLDEDCVMLDAGEAGMGGACREAIRRILGQVRAVGFLAGLRRRVIEERAPAADLRRLIHLVLFTLHRDVAQSERIRQGDAQPAPPVY